MERRYNDLPRALREEVGKISDTNILQVPGVVAARNRLIEADAACDARQAKSAQIQ